MRDPRVVSPRIGPAHRLAAAIIVVVGSAGCSAEPARAARATTLFKCAGHMSFTVQRDEASAIVIHSGIRYELPRRKSSIGERYASDSATLIVDGEMAAFVGRTILNLDFCRAAKGNL